MVVHAFVIRQAAGGSHAAPTMLCAGCGKRSQELRKCSACRSVACEQGWGQAQRMWGECSPRH